MTEVLLDQTQLNINSSQLLKPNTQGKLPKNRKFTINDFEIKKEVGKGTYGQVFLATFGGFNYAIKTVAKDFIMNVSFL